MIPKPVSCRIVQRTTHMARQTIRPGKPYMFSEIFIVTEDGRQYYSRTCCKTRRTSKRHKSRASNAAWKRLNARGSIMVWIARSRLVTAHILYRMPDHLWLLQTYVWQEYDRMPGLPALRKFLKFWIEKPLDGPIFSVKIADAEIAGDDIMRFADYEGKLQ